VPNNAAEPGASADAVGPDVLCAVGAIHATLKAAAIAS
jgi:hypothetical protein